MDQIKKYLVIIILSLYSILNLSGDGKILNEEQITERINGYISARIFEPYITKQYCPIPGLYCFTAFPEEYANEDPIIEDTFFINNTGEIYEELPLDQIKYTPKDREDAIIVGVWLLIQHYHYIIIDNTEYTITENSIVLVITADYYSVHPYYDPEPVHGVMFEVVCNNGIWTISQK